MIKEILERKEKVLYQTIKNALENHKVGHSFLLAGDKNPLKLDTAYLIAQSIIEDQGKFADEDSVISRRIRNNEYLDVVLIDGSEKAIKKDQIDDLLVEFAKTSIEDSNHRVYIINNINNASTKVLNMILKFMEEPNENITGILISDHINGLLPTIISRCQVLNFHSLNKEDLIELYLKDGFDKIDAYFLASMLKCYKKLKLDDECFIKAKDLVAESIELFNNIELLEINFSHFYSDNKKGDTIKDTLNYYVALMIVYLNDAIVDVEFDDFLYNKQLKALRNYRLDCLLEAYLKTYDKMKYNFDRKLLLDELLYEISMGL